VAVSPDRSATLWTDNHSANGSPGILTELVLERSGKGPPREGDAPAKPKTIANVQLTSFAHNRGPSLPARPPPSKNTGNLTDNHSANGSLAIVTELVLEHSGKGPPREGDAPAEPKTIANVLLTSFAHGRSPSIPARPLPAKNTGDFKGDEKFVPGLKPRLRFCPRRHS
jgi:hypothetical protein